MVAWDSIIRFTADDGKIYYAPFPLDKEPTRGIQVEAYVSIEDIETGEAGNKVEVSKLLAPVPETNNPIICIGMNYRNHAEEAKLNIPTHPPMWYKPPSALSNPEENIPIPKQAHESFLDFEGEIVIVTSKAAKDISAAETPSYILGYTIGNDLTARMYQDPKRCGGQFTYAKAFDKFAPLGPRLVSPAVFNGQVNSIETRVNGRVVQKSPLDFIFPVNELVSFLTQGTTLPAGSVIMTGTPSGVGWFQNPQCPLRDEDVVEIEAQPIGILQNKMSYQ